MPELDEMVWGGSTPEEIDAYNAQAVPVYSYATSADNAYEAEQRAIAMRDPRVQAAAQKQAMEAEVYARRFKGYQEYQQLVDGGATPEEALRRVAPDLYFNAPGEFTTALRYTRPPSLDRMVPQSVPIEGGRVLTGGNRWQFIPDAPIKATPEEVAKAAMEKEIRAGLQSKLNALYRAQAGGMAGLLNTNLPTEIADLEKQLAAMRGQTNAPAAPIDAAVEEIKNLQETPIKPSSRPNIVTISTKQAWDELPSGTVYVGKDGRRYRKP